jgi:Arc/MetJ-type ribon-helix-helix transcriptional regulator
LKSRALSGVSVGDDGTVYNYEAERARLTHEQANKVSLEVAELRGELVRASEVGPYWDDMVSSMRAKLVGMPPKLAAMIADAIARAKFQSQAEAAVYEALAEIEKDGLPAAARERHARAVGKSRAESGEAAAETDA